MRKNFMFIAIAVLLGGAGLTLGLKWFAQRPAKLVATEKDLIEARRRIGDLPGQIPTTTAPPLDAKYPVRLVVGVLGAADENQNRQLADLLVADLSHSSGLELVDRDSIDKVLN